MTSLLATWTGFFTWCGKAFTWSFQFLPKMGFYINFTVWIIIAIAFFYWTFKQAQDTKKAKAEGRLI